MGKFLRDHPIGGAALYVGPLLTIIGFVMDALHAAEVFPPPILEAIGLAIFFAGVIGILHRWYLTAISPAGVKTPETPKSRRSKAATASSASDRNASASLFRAMVIGIAILGVFFGSLITYMVYRYGTYRDAIENTRLEIANTVVVPPGQRRLPNTDPNLFLNFYTANRGFYTIVGLSRNTTFNVVPHMLTLAEEDRLMKVTDAGTDEPNKQGEEIYPNHSGPWFSAYSKINTDQWNDIIAGDSNQNLYVMIEIKYYVRTTIRITEKCMIFNKGVPSVNNCLGHNKIFTEN